MKQHATLRRGMTLIGVLVTMALIIALFAILMTQLSNTIGTGGTATGVQENQASTFADRTNLQRIYQGMSIFATSNDMNLPSPTLIAKSNDKTIDTSANFWSAMIAQQFVSPGQLVSENEQNGNIWVDDDYNVGSATGGLPWDSAFSADLNNYSNVSFAHQVLHGERFRRGWRHGSSSYPVLSNRGPKDGAPDPNSWTTDNTNGSWAGNVVFADGHVSFFQTMTPPILGGENLFADESGPGGADAILSFTQQIWDGGYTLQWD